jgi:hypothetical protein
LFDPIPGYTPIRGCVDTKGFLNAPATPARRRS